MKSILVLNKHDMSSAGQRPYQYFDKVDTDSFRGKFMMPIQTHDIVEAVLPVHFAEIRMLVLKRLATLWK